MKNSVPVPGPEEPRPAAEWLESIFDGPSMSDGHPALSLRQVGARFGGVAALSEISFDVQAHDVVAVVGPNGAGKSTLLNAISGLVRDNVTGQILFGGEPMHGKSPSQIAALGVGRSFQDPPLIDTETVMENVLVGAHLRLDYRMGDQIWRRRRVREREADAMRRAAAILEFANLSDVRNLKVGALAYGKRKLIDVARALISGPRVLLLDEPTSGLDPDEQKAVGRLLTELHRATPTTILMVEHHMDVVRTVANKVLGLQSGSVLVSGTPDEVLDSAAFRSAIVGSHTDGAGPADESATPGRKD
jgi:branched-chain amino acid transport system ATP-binding protein